MCWILTRTPACIPGVEGSLARVGGWGFVLLCALRSLDEDSQFVGACPLFSHVYEYVVVYAYAHTRACLCCTNFSGCAHTRVWLRGSRGEQKNLRVCLVSAPVSVSRCMSVRLCACACVCVSPCASVGVGRSSCELGGQANGLTTCVQVASFSGSTCPK